MRLLPPASTTRQITGAALLAAACAMIVPAPARAANITLEPSIGERGSWESNPLMLTRDEKALWGSTTTPRLIFTDQTRTSELTADVSVDENVFNQTKFNSTDFNGKFGVAAQTRRWAASLRQSTTYDTTRTSELTTFGESIGAIRHLGLSAAPKISFSPASMDKFILESSALTSRYDDRVFTDYNVFFLKPSWERKITPLHTAIFLVQAQRFRTANGPSNASDSIGPMLGWKASFTPRLSLKAAAGPQASRQKRENFPAQDWKWDYVFSGNFLYKSEQDTLELTAARARHPYGDGTERLLTTFSAKETRAFNSRLSLNLLASCQFAKESEETDNSLKSLIKAGSGLTYRATENLDISMAYTYKNESLTGEDEAAKGNIAMLGLVYRPWGETVTW